jgi:peptidoglycan/LPS O-acetylase OafA/YrhL
MKYRADVDGLRALAVLPVVLYHARVWPFSGGYVGVDIFFVISGYLITGLIYNDILDGDFSITRFYERRIRRIFPALFVVIAFCFLIGFLLLMPFEFKQFAESAVAMAAFASNLLFWGQSGYFDSAASLKPLLHTWSLAVEEQFYLFFPLLLIVTSRLAKKRLVAVIAVLATVSFAFAVWEVAQHSVAAFYSPACRAWELFMGALLALWKSPTAPNRGVAEISAIAGIGLIGGSVLSYSSTTQFPGAAALLPCLGAALIIRSGESSNTFISRLLSARVPVFIGLISYSLYLWHWPLIVFSKYYLMRELSDVQTLGALVLSGLLASLSWYYVELPCRRTRGIPRRLVFGSAAVTTAVSAAAGLCVYLSLGLPQRLPPDVRRLAMGAGDSDVGQSTCDGKTPQAILDGQACTIGDTLKAGPASFALLGDSLAVALLPAIERDAEDAHRKGVILTKGGCLPLLGARLYDDYHADCPRFNAASMQFLRGHPEISDVVIVARWTIAAAGTDGVSRTGVWLTDEYSSTSSYNENKRVFVRALDRTIRKLEPHQVFLVAGYPEPLFDVPMVEALAKYLHQPATAELSRHAFDQRQAFVNDTLRQAAARYPWVRVLDLSRYLCDGNGCPVTRDGRSLYADEVHLSRYGALAVSDVFSPVFSAESERTSTR